MSNNINTIRSQYLPEVYLELENIYPIVAYPNTIEQIPEAIRNQIFEQVYALAGRPETEDWWWGGRNAFQDLHRLQDAVHQVAFNLFRALPENLRNAVAGRIYNYSGSPVTSDPHWGENHANDDARVLLYSLEDEDSRYWSLHRFQRDIESLARFERLPEAIRNQIYGRVYALAGRPETDDDEWGRHHVFQDWHRLQVALQHVVFDLFRALPDEVRNAVSARIYENYGCPETSDPQWGENHANDNTEVLIRSLVEGVAVFRDDAAVGFHFSFSDIFGSPPGDIRDDDSSDSAEEEGSEGSEGSISLSGLFSMIVSERNLTANQAALNVVNFGIETFLALLQLQLTGVLQPQAPSINGEEFEASLRRAREEAASSNTATSVCSSVAIPTQGEMVQRKVHALARLNQLEVMGSSINNNFEANPAILSFDLDAILQRYPVDQDPTRLYNFIIWAGVEDHKFNDFFAAISQFDVEVDNPQHTIVKELLCRLYSYFNQRALHVVGGSDDENRLKAQYRLYADKIIDANRNCIDQVLSQLQEIMLDIASDVFIEGSQANPFAPLQARAGHVLCTYRTQLVKEICRLQYPNEIHMADLERMVMQRLAPELGINGAIFHVGAHFSRMVQDAENKVNRAIDAFRQEYRPLEHLTNELKTAGINPMNKLRNALLLWATDHYGMATEEPDAIQATDMNPRLSAHFNPDSTRDNFIDGGEWSPAAACLILEATNLIRMR